MTPINRSHLVLTFFSGFVACGIIVCVWYLFHQKESVYKDPLESFWKYDSATRNLKYELDTNSIVVRIDTTDRIPISFDTTYFLIDSLKKELKKCKSELPKPYKWYKLDKALHEADSANERMNRLFHCMSCGLDTTTFKIQMDTTE